VWCGGRSATEHVNAPKLQTTRAADLTLAYRELGSGPPVLLLHGWPTSSFLWRQVMQPIAGANRVLALDLPGFGGSDKPPGARYGFEFFERAIDGFLAELGIGEVGVAGHDIGGPIAVHWALGRPKRATRLALLNTLLYPDFSDAVMEFVRAASTPGLRDQLTSPEGLEAAMRLGLSDDERLTEEVRAGVCEPFRSDASRRSLADAGIGLEPEEFAEIASGLSSLQMPVRIIYGEKDRILPDIAETVARLQEDLPQAQVTALPDCGHFLQEEAPDRVGELLAGFFAGTSDRSAPAYGSSSPSHSAK
jgi:pimeloyl-ACP methyl ester carboxylesterase